MVHTVLQPSLLRIGAGVSRTLPSVLGALNLRRPLLVTDDFIKRSGAPEPFVRVCHYLPFAYGSSALAPHPKQSRVPAAFAERRGQCSDCLH